MNRKIHKILLTIIYILVFICIALLAIYENQTTVPIYFSVSTAIVFVLGLVIGDQSHDVLFSKREMPCMKIDELLCMCNYKGAVKIIVNDEVSLSIASIDKLKQIPTSYLDLEIDKFKYEGNTLVIICTSKVQEVESADKTKNSTITVKEV